MDKESNTKKDVLNKSDSENSDGEGELKIVIESPSPKRRKKIEIPPEEKFIIEHIEKDLDKALEDKAEKNNLSSLNVKSILRHVVGNEEVLAYVKQCENLENTSDLKLSYEPKLTRAKAKELFSTKSETHPLNWLPPSKPSPVSLLLNGDEFQEESSGDEYVPGEESEEDQDSTLHSESEPPTPQSVTDNTPVDSVEISVTEDGMFKIPKSKEKVETEDATIALRTRSKLCLSSTPLEVIEESFIPPDITRDMYDLDCDDEDWADFLKKFTRPLDEMKGEDEDQDPEYNLLADVEANIVDKEELRADKGVVITRKELNDLMAELSDYIDCCSETKKTRQDISPEPEILVLRHEFPEYNETNSENCNEKRKSDDNIASKQNVETKIDETEQISMLFEQKSLLDQQMRQHVQLLTQNFILTFHHPEFNHFAGTFKEYLYNLKLLGEIKDQSAFTPVNLHSAIKLVEDWEKRIGSESIEAEEYRRFVIKDLETCKWRQKVSHETAVPQIPPLILETISASDVFIYPSLLPQIAFKPTCLMGRKKELFRHDDELIAIGLEQFVPYLKENPLYQNQRGQISYKRVSNIIHKYLVPVKNGNAIYKHIIDCKNGKLSYNSPIRFYFTYGKAPTSTHYVLNLDTFGVLPPRARSPETLPYQWRKWIYPGEVVPTCNAVSLQTLFSTKPPSPSNVYNPDQYRWFIANNFNSVNTILPYTTIPVPYTIIQRNPPLQLLLPKTVPATTPNFTRQVTLTKKRKRYNLLFPKKHKKLEKYFKPPFIAKKWLDAILNSDIKEYKFNSSCLKSVCKNINENMLPSMPSLFNTPMKSTNLVFASTSSETNAVKCVTNCENNTEFQLEQENENKIEEKSEKEETIEPERTINNSSISSNKQKRKAPQIPGEKKKIKMRKEFSANLAMFSPEDPKIIAEKQTSYAHAYYDKIRERLDVDDYHRVMEILNDHEESGDTPDILYKKLEKVFLPKHPDLAEEFLTFLTPSQAAAVGKLMQYFVMTKMSMFLRKLELFFKNQPSHMKKIYRCLGELTDCPDVSMEKVKSSILPLLKGNKHLCDWFLQIFPSEPPPQSLLNGCYETVDVTLPVSEESYETVIVPDVEDVYGGLNCICNCHSIEDEAFKSRTRHCIPCGTKFLQGHIYVQTGKNLRLANVTFNSKNRMETINRLAPRSSSSIGSKHRPDGSPCKQAVSPTKEDTDEEMLEGRRRKSRQTSRSPRKRKPKSKCEKEKIEGIKEMKDAEEEAKELEGIDELEKDGDDMEKHGDEVEKDVDDLEKDVDELEKDVDELEKDVDDLEKDVDIRHESMVESPETDGNISFELRLSPYHSAESGSEYVEESSQDNIINSDSGSDDGASDSTSSSECGDDNTSWTRDEDKVILETFRREDSKAQALQKVSEELIHRTMKQIKNRFKRLMKLLQQICT